MIQTFNVLNKPFTRDFCWRFDRDLCSVSVVALKI